MSTDKQFEWTDELVMEFANDLPVDEMANGQHIYDFKKSKQSSLPEPKPTVQDGKLEPKSDVLFTTEDGVGIKVGDTYFVNDGWYRVCQKLAKKDSKYPPYIADKAFSTKALADQYIIENKPCLSLNDLLEVWSDKGNSSDNPNYYKAAPLYKKFEEKAKQKLNKQ